jgi:hypothetical protein
LHVSLQIVILALTGITLGAPGRNKKEVEVVLPTNKDSEASVVQQHQPSTLSVAQYTPVELKVSGGASSSKDKLETSESFGLGYSLGPHHGYGAGHGYGLGGVGTGHGHGHGYGLGVGHGIGPGEGHHGHGPAMVHPPPPPHPLPLGEFV